MLSYAEGKRVPSSSKLCCVCTPTQHLSNSTLFTLSSHKRRKAYCIDFAGRLAFDAAMKGFRTVVIQSVSQSVSHSRASTLARESASRFSLSDSRTRARRPFEITARRARYGVQQTERAGDREKEREWRKNERERRGEGSGGWTGKGVSP